MVSKTFDEWAREGYRVMRGEKATGRDKQGMATFNEYQVIEIDDWICDPYTE